MIRVLNIGLCSNRGGIETFVIDLHRNIDRSQVQFDYIIQTSEKCFFEEEVTSLGGVVYNVPPKRKNLKSVFTNIFAITQVVRKNKYSVVHVHAMSTYIAACDLLAAALGGAKVRIAHSQIDSIMRHKQLNAFCRLPLHLLTTNRLACSLSAGKWMFIKDFTVINNGISVDKFTYNVDLREKMRKKLGVSDKLVIGNIGRFTQQKNHTFLIDIFDEVKKLHPESVLLLVGDGLLRNGIEEKVLRLGLSDSVVFTGVRSDIPDLLQVMDVFLFPSLYEGLGIVLIEAQTSGLPCIASDVVPEEAKVTDLLEYVSLSEPAEKWAEIILSKRDYERKSHAEEVKKAGFDIAEIAKQLAGFYEGV